MAGFGERLRTLRTSKGWSLDQLASETGISRAYLWKLERKPSANPSLDRMEILAEALDTTVGQLAGGLETVSLPESLEECARKHSLPPSDVQDLARIRFRGAQPVSSDDWYLIYLQLKKTLAAPES